jgi:hypothetical protein
MHERLESRGIAVHAKAVEEFLVRHTFRETPIPMGFPVVPAAV